MLDDNIAQIRSSSNARPDEQVIARLGKYGGGGHRQRHGARAVLQIAHAGLCLDKAHSPG
jgi:hypothetical protein